MKNQEWYQKAWIWVILYLLMLWPIGLIVMMIQITTKISAIEKDSTIYKKKRLIAIDVEIDQLMELQQSQKVSTDSQISELMGEAISLGKKEVKDE